MALKVLAVQLDSVWEDKATNFATARRLVKEAKPEPGTLVVLPETFATGFSMNVGVVAEPEEGPTLGFLAEMAQEFGVCVVGGFVARGADGEARNLSVAMGPDGKQLASYAKMRPFRPGGECYTAGTEPTVFEWQGATISPYICYDLRFPEVFRIAAARWQPTVYTVIASWPVARILHWVRLLQARAIENQAYVIGVNRTGDDPDYTHVGRSIVVDFNGEIIADAGEAEGVISAELDLDRLAAYRRDRPFLGDLSNERIF